MSAEIIGLVGVGVILLGQVGSVVIFLKKTGENNKKKIEEETEEWTTLRNTIDNISNELGDDTYGLKALNEQISGVQTHCASVTAEYSTKLTEHERRLNVANGKKAKK